MKLEELPQDDIELYDWCEIIGVTDETHKPYGPYVSIDVRNGPNGELSDWRPSLDEMVAVHGTGVSGADSGEPTFFALVELTGERWAAVEGWHDFTGWDCQAGVTWNLALSREAAWNFGFGDEARQRIEVSNAEKAAAESDD